MPLRPPFGPVVFTSEPARYCPASCQFDQLNSRMFNAPSLCLITALSDHFTTFKLDAAEAQQSFMAVCFRVTIN